MWHANNESENKGRKKNIKMLREKKNYKYLEILEEDTTSSEDERKRRKEYLKQMLLKPNSAEEISSKG